MKKLLLILNFFVVFGCFGQKIDKDLHLTVSVSINQNDEHIKEVISTVRAFLETKNDSYTENKYWLKQDFDKYKYPYIDLYNIENGRLGKNFYQPTLMEIIPTDQVNQWVVKLAFIGHNTETNQNQVRVIYNIIASKINDEIKLSRYQDFVLESWQYFKKESISYYISPVKKINEAEVSKQQKDIEMLCNFFNTQPIPLIYISCINPKEVFEVKGFDYNPMMYVGNTGGFAEHGNFILSGNNSEVYTHEIVHIYTMNLFPNIKPFFDEGLATFLAGSGTFDYAWHKEKLKRFLIQNPTFQIEHHMEDLYERLYFEEETSIPYLIAAVICEYVLEVHGKEIYFELLNDEDDLWNSLKKVGLTQENINNVIRNKLEI